MVESTMPVTVTCSKLLYQSLRALSKKTIPMTLIRRIYELKLLYLEGQGPQVLECVHCKMIVFL